MLYKNSNAYKLLEEIEIGLPEKENDDGVDEPERNVNGGNSGVKRKPKNRGSRRSPVRTGKEKQKVEED